MKYPAPGLPLMIISCAGIDASPRTPYLRDNAKKALNTLASPYKTADIIRLLQVFRLTMRRLPVPAFDLELYCKTLPDDERSAQKLGTRIEGLSHFILSGFRHGSIFVPLPSKDRSAGLIRNYFDRRAYKKSLDAAGIALPKDLSLLQHYLSAGFALGLSPSEEFCEVSYLLRYPDVALSIARGGFLCGFVHYLMHGLSENRSGLPFTQSQYLQTFYPELLNTSPGNHASQMRKFTCLGTSPPFKLEAKDKKSLLLCLHSIDTEIKFGGMSALYRIIDALCLQVEFDIIDIVLTDQPAGLAGGLYQILNPFHPLNRYAHKARIHSLVSDRKGNLNYSGGGLPSIGVNTVAIAYNAKAAYLLDSYKGRYGLEWFKWIYLIQEDESTFHPGGSLAALIRHTYSLDYYPIYNSKILERYMLGSYPSRSSRRGISFDHQYILPDREFMSEHRRDIIVCYFRPERHADRNCHEIITMALELCIASRPSISSWEIIGIGALSDYSVKLVNNVEMKCLSKMSYEAYSTLLGSAKVGISLMDAPHPSVVPFEMAAHGLITITNTHPSRSQSDIESLDASGNIRACSLSHVDVSEGILNAIDEWDERGSNAISVAAESSRDSLQRRWNVALAPVVSHIRCIYNI